MLQAEPEDGTGTPLGLAGVVVEIAKHRGVDDEGGTDEISGTDVIDNCRTAIDNQIGEVGIFVHTFAIHCDFVIIVNNDCGHQGEMEEPSAIHQVITITTPDGNISHLEV